MNNLNLEKQQLKEFFQDVDNILFDCDGVLWLGKEVIPHVPETLKFLRKQGKRLFFITNNSTQSRASYLEKFKKFDIEVQKDEIFGSAYLTALYIKNNLHLPEGKKVFVIGMDGIKQELSELDINYFSLDNNSPVSLDSSLLKYKPDESVACVLVGMDIDINYSKYAYAHQCLIKQPEIPFLATNSDKTYPLSGTTFPGTGAILSPLITSTGRQPILLGKPNLHGLTVLKQSFDLVPERTCMIGDRLDTDILFGLEGGLKTLLVLSGVTDLEILKTSKIQPDVVVKDLPTVLNALN